LSRALPLRAPAAPAPGSGAPAPSEPAPTAPAAALPWVDTGAPRGAARSLFGEILDWMFAPLLLLWPMSVSLTYLVAQSIASSPYDHALVERGEALAAHVRFEGAHPRFELGPGMLEVYGDGIGDMAPYLVVVDDGRVLAGDPDLPHPGAQAGLPAGPGSEPNAEAFALSDDTVRGRPVRMASAWVRAPAANPGERSAAVLLVVAESPAERTQLANEIVKGVILPQFVVLPLALVLVWFGLSRGLAPLARLQGTIRSRAPDDLSPIRPQSAPEELTPLLQSFNELLARMSHSLDVQKRFIADAAHQLKTPLAGLRTQAELALREGDAQELQRSLRQIADASVRATRLVNQLLALARAEHAAGDAATPTPVDLEAIARAVVQDWVPQALAQGVDLGYEAGPGASVILGTPVLLRELLNNLLDNALRYGSSAGGHAAAVTVRVRATQAQVVLEVEDNGPGIAPEERARIFERFYRVLGSTQEGSGLGLAIVAEIARQHGAHVEVADAGPADSARASPGTVFRVHFARH